MEDIILSILLIKHMTIYELRGFIGQNLNFACSDSMGSIQAAIKKLLEKAFIEYEECFEKGVKKKIYRITELGTVRLLNWIKVPMEINKAKNMEESKFFFLGLADRKTRIESLESYIENLKAEKMKLLQLREVVLDSTDNVIKLHIEKIINNKELCEKLIKISGEEDMEHVIGNIYRYQIYTLEHGISSIENDIIFYENVLLKERELYEA